MALAPVGKHYPNSVFDAVIIQLLCIILSLIGMTLDVIFTEMPFTSYVLQMGFAFLYLIFPYKIMRGSDFFRFMFVVLESVSMAIYFTTEISIPQFSTIATFIQFPLIGYTIYLLFSKESNKWFALLKSN